MESDDVSSFAADDFFYGIQGDAMAGMFRLKIFGFSKDFLPFNPSNFPSASFSFLFRISLLAQRAQEVCGLMQAFNIYTIGECLQFGSNSFYPKLLNETRPRKPAPPLLADTRHPAQRNLPWLSKNFFLAISVRRRDRCLIR